MMNKACPVVLRKNNNNLELLMFTHPNKGNQLVKGGLKKGEELESACIRELEEESGIKAVAVKRLGVWEPGYKNQVWGFCLMHYEDILPDTWTFETKDDGGHDFTFFWHPLSRSLNGDWEDIYKRAFQYILSALGK